MKRKLGSIINGTWVMCSKELRKGELPLANLCSEGPAKPKTDSRNKASG